MYLWFSISGPHQYYVEDLQKYKIEELSNSVNFKALTSIFLWGELMLTRVKNFSAFNFHISFFTCLMVIGFKSSHFRHINVLAGGI